MFIPPIKMKSPLISISLIFIACLLFESAGLSARAQQQQSPQQQQRLAALSPDDKARGVALYEQHDMSGAITALRAAVKKDKNDADAWYFLGRALSSDSKLKEARKAFEKAIKARPTLSKAHTGLAYTLLFTTKSQDALREAQAALQLDPKDAEAHYIIGVIALRRDSGSQALNEANTSLALSQNFAPSLLLKSQALMSVYSDGVAEAMRLLDLETSLRVEAEQDKEARSQRYKERQEKLMPLLKEAAGSLELYLKLVPQNPQAAIWREQLETLKVYSGLADNGPDGKSVFGPSEVTIKARIISRPEPQYTEEARGAQVTGTVLLRAVLAVDGNVKHILVIRGLPHGLTEKAVYAARQIHFVPAIKDGHPVSQYIQIEYNFNLY